MTPSDPALPQVRRALVLAAGWTVVFVAASVAAFVRGDEELRPFALGALLGVLGIVLLLRRSRQLRAAPPRVASPAKSVTPPVATPPEAGEERSGPSLEEAFAAHQAELEGLPSGAERGRITMIWQQEMDEHAHDYLDLLLTVPDAVTPRVFALHAGAIIHSWLAGYMVRRGWVDEREALQAPYRFGRRLRDELRALGLPIESLRSTFGVVVDRTLGKITRAGMAGPE